MLALGTKKRDRQAFEDTLDRLRAKLSIGGGETETVGARPDRAHASAGPPAAHRRSAARARFPRDGVREAEARTPRVARREQDRSAEHRGARARALEQSLSQGRRPLRADVRRGARGDQGGEARRGEGFLHALRRRRQCGARDRRRFRPRRDEDARHRALRRMEEPVAVRARAQSVPAAGAHGDDRADARQGERHDVRARAAQDQRSQRRPAGADRRRQDPRRVAGVADSRIACARRKA